MNTIDLPLSLPKVSLESLTWNLLLCTILAGILCWHYYIRAQKKYLRRDLALVLPVICLTTLLVITVVKSSLALSLGLVGALSIVRFRTPIKEPEELAYIFLAIALGLALGADQREVAAVSVPLILGFISAIGFFTKENSSPNGNLLITVEVPRNDNGNENLEDILKAVANICPTIEVRKIHQDNRIFTIVAIVNVNEPEILTKFSESFNSEYPLGRFTFIDDSSFPNE